MLKGAVSAFDTELAAVPRSFTHSQACRKSGDFRYKTFELPWPRTWTEKLADSKDLPKVVKLTGAAAKKWGCKTLAIAASSEIDTLMRQVSRGKVTTTQELRAAVAQMHAAEQGCPLTTGIFSWIAAHAAAEQLDAGKVRVTPFWLTLKAGGELNPKFPGGVERQKAFLTAEGHQVVAKGKKFLVRDF